MGSDIYLAVQEHVEAHKRDGLDIDLAEADRRIATIEGDALHFSPSPKSDPLHRKEKPSRIGDHRGGRVGSRPTINLGAGNRAASVIYRAALL
jgi:hypothetical protein